MSQSLGGPFANYMAAAAVAANRKHFEGPGSPLMPSPAAAGMAAASMAAAAAAGLTPTTYAIKNPTPAIRCAAAAGPVRRRSEAARAWLLDSHGKQRSKSSCSYCSRQWDLQNSRNAGDGMPSAC